MFFFKLFYLGTGLQKPKSYYFFFAYLLAQHIIVVGIYYIVLLVSTYTVIPLYEIYDLSKTLFYTLLSLMELMERNGDGLL